MSALEDLRHMTVPEYIHVAGLFDWERTELVEGIVYDMPAEKNRHRMTVLHVGDLLREGLPAHEVSNTGSVQLGPESLVEPDVFVLETGSAQDPDGYPQASDLVLVVEVAVSTLNKDLGPKLKAYARARIPEVWVIDPRPLEGWLLRHTDPAGRRYKTVQRHSVGENAERLDLDVIRG